jgi:predicted GNAT family acetyltransferase
MGMKPNAMVTVTREDDSEALEFVLRVDGERLGSLDYTLPDATVMRIEYVEVAPELRGSGLGQKLVAAAVDWARESNRKIVPICGYARAVIARDGEMSKLLR